MAGPGLSKPALPSGLALESKRRGSYGAPRILAEGEALAASEMVRLAIRISYTGEDAGGAIWTSSENRCKHDAQQSAFEKVFRRTASKMYTQ